MSAVRRITADNLEDFFVEKEINRFETDFDDYIENQADEISIKSLNDLIERDMGVDNLEDNSSRRSRESRFSGLLGPRQQSLSSVEKLKETLSNHIVPLENLRERGPPHSGPIRFARFIEPWKKQGP